MTKNNFFKEQRCLLEVTIKILQVVLGAVAIARRRVETVEEIRARVEAALEHIPRERLVLAPDCGLGMLPLDIIRCRDTFTSPSHPLTQGKTGQHGGGGQAVLILYMMQ